MNVGGVFPPVGCCPPFQLPHVDTTLIWVDNFVECGIWVAKFCLRDRFVDVSRGALREGLIYCGKEDILGMV